MTVMGGARRFCAFGVIMRKLSLVVTILLAAALGAPAWAATTFTEAQYAKARQAILVMGKLNLLTLRDATLHSDVEGKVHVGGNLSGNNAAVGIGHAGKTFKADPLVRTLTVGGNLTGGININNGIGLGAIEAIVGGNASSVGINLGSASSAKLMVGGTFDAQNFNPSSKKTATYGTSASNVQVQDKAYIKVDATLKAGGTKDAKATIANVTASVASQMTTLSQILGALTPNATLNSANQNDIHFTFSASANTGDFAVANISASQLASGTFVMPTYAAGKTLIVNVSGSSATIGANMTGSNSTLSAAQSNIIWNFTDATTVNVNTAIYGSVLAVAQKTVGSTTTYATVSGNSPINGSVVTQVFNSNGEVHLGTFSGKTPFLVTTPPPHSGGGGGTEVGAVPEPSSWMTMLLGFGFTGSIIRRQRRKERLATA